MTQQAISGYRIQGEALVLAFLNESLAQRVRDIENGVQDSVIGEHLKNIVTTRPVLFPVRQSAPFEQQ